MIAIDSNPLEGKVGFLTSPLIIEDVLDKEEITSIEKIIDALHSSEATVNYGEKDDNVASFKLAWIPFNDNTAWLYGRLYDIVHMYNDESFEMEPLDMVERIMYCEYGEGDFHSWHLDIADVPPFLGRKLTVTVQLSSSDDYRGGNLTYMLDGYSVPRSQGTFIIHPSYLLHSTEPVVSGTKKTLTYWLGGTKFR